MIYTFEGFELDTDVFELRHNGERCPLEPQAFDVLRYLVEHRDRVVTKEELIDHIWPERFISEAALTTRLMEARRALGDSGREQRYIRTVHGRGYRFVGEVAAGVETIAPPEQAVPSPGSEAARRFAIEEPEIRFCTTSDGVRIAYATSGQGPPLVKVANWLSHLEYDWRSPIWRHWIEELSRDHMFVRYDERGCGLSDWDPEDFSFDGWQRDLEAVVDALGLERFPLMGISQGGPVAITYAVHHPDRVSQLILYGTYARGREYRLTPEQLEEERALTTLTRMGWGRDDPTYRQIFTSGFIPDATPEQMRWFNDIQRASASGENAARFREEFNLINVEELLAHVHVPTLVLHARGDRRVPFEEGRRLAAGITGARFVPLDGQNHILLENEVAWQQFLTEVRRFLGVETGERRPAPAAAPVTVLFTDIVSSTAITQRLGDARAREVLREHDGIVRGALAAHQGTEVKHTGDGIMASFPSPSRALECAVAIQRAIAARRDEVPLEVRIGVNAGEPLAEDADLFGSAVQLARRACEAAGGGEILVSDVVRGLAAGKGFAFVDRGEFALKGFEEPARLYEVRWEE